MEFEEYDPPPPAFDNAPDPRASQRVAAQHRQRATAETEAPAAAPPRLPFAIGAAIVVLLTMAAITWQLGQPPARPLVTPTPVPTDVPARAFDLPHQATSTPFSALPTAKAIDVVPTPTAPLLAPPEPPPQTGQGLAVDHAPAAEWIPPEPTPALPPEPTAPAVWPTSAPAVPADFEQPSLIGTCQFIGCLGEKAVDLAREQACHALRWQYGAAEPETIPEPDYSAVRGCIWEGLYR